MGLEPGPEPLSPGLQHPREGQKLVKLEGARRRRPATSGTHGAPRDAGTIQLPPLSPSGPVRTQVILAEDALAGAGRLRHTALRWRVQTPRTRRRTAAPAERLPPGVLMERMASGQRSTDSISAGGQGCPRASATPAELALLRASQRPGSLSDTFHRRGHRRAPGRTLRTPAGSGLTSGCNCRKMRRTLLRRMTAPDSEARPLCGPSATSHRETAGLARKFVPAPAD